LDLAVLHKAVYGIDQPVGYWQQKYNTAYTGAQYIGFIAYKSDLPVAYYGVMPCFIQSGSSSILSAQSGDTMTHPQYRYKGMFVELATRTYELCRNEGIRLIFGFPNQNSYHGLVNKLGWIVTGYMDRFTIPVSTFPLERLMKKFSRSRRWYQRYCQRILQQYCTPYAGLPNAFIGEGFAGVQRDEVFLQYKSYGNTQVFKIGNAAIWARIKDGFMIGDMQVPGNEFDIVMRRIKRVAARLGVRQIIFQVSPGTRLHALFVQRFTPSPSFPVVFRDLGAGIDLPAIKFTFGDIDVF
jgi:hypothetical protein